MDFGQVFYAFVCTERSIQYERNVSFSLDQSNLTFLLFNTSLMLVLLYR